MTADALRSRLLPEHSVWVSQCAEVPCHDWPFCMHTTVQLQSRHLHVHRVCNLLADKASPSQLDTAAFYSCCPACAMMPHRNSLEIHGIFATGLQLKGAHAVR